MNRERLNNIFIVCGEGYTFSKFYLKKNSVFLIYVNFPDPWPKRRHQKNRLVNLNFVEEVKRTLKQGKTIFFVTDDKETLKSIKEQIFSSGSFISFFKDPYYVNEIKNYGSSYFDSLWRSKGKKIYYLRFIKKVGTEGFEPPTYWSQTSRANQTALCPEHINFNLKKSFL